jgi:hypothetical protein
MTSSETEIVYLGADNSIDLILKADGVVQNIASLTKVELDFPDEYGVTTISGETSGTPFDWETNAASGKLVISLGAETGISAGMTYYDVRLVIYDADNTNGIVWDTINLDVR